MNNKLILPIVAAIILSAAASVFASWQFSTVTAADLRVYIAKDEAEKRGMKATIARIEKMVQKLYDREFSPK